MQAALELSRRVGKRQLEAWLIGGAGKANARTFVLAVLRDIYVSESDVRRWLSESRLEFGGACADDWLGSHRSSAVERLAIREWNSR